MGSTTTAISENPLTYPRSKDAYSASLFRNPTSEYRGAPLWSWNAKLDRETLLRQIDVMKEMGMGGFHMHVRVGLDTEYMGDEFMGYVQDCVRYAKENGMLACLYDEDRWPSGAAGGLVTKDHPEFASQHMLLTAKPYGSGETEQPPAFMGFAARSELGTLVARYDIQLSGEGDLKSARRLGDDEVAQDGANIYYAYMEPNIPSPWFNGATYADTLSPKTISRFIETTHEKYKDVLSDNFGNTVPSIFCDEPQFAHKTQLPTATSRADNFLPWTADLPSTFRKTYKYDILDHLPEMIWNLPNSDASLARYHFHDHVCERFVSAFMDQLATWCRGNGIALTGHMMEEPFLKTQTASLGEAMRCYRGLDLPGIDLLCDQFEYNTVKQATSVARQNGARGVMSEIYGVTNWTFTFEGHKGCGDWQAAMGVTFRVHHLFWVTMAGEAKRDFPACIGYQSPWYKEYSTIEDYFSRINVAMTRGKPLTRVAVIHPVESYWLCYGPADSGRGEPEFREQCFRDLTHWLSHGLLDFDFISESLFPSQTALEEVGCPLQVGCCSYDVVLVPNLRTIRSTTLDRLRKFAAAGGKVYICGDAPTLEDAATPESPPTIESSIIIPWTEYSILGSLQQHKDISITTAAGLEAKTLLYQMREDGDERYVFICNTERLKPVSTVVSLRGQWDVTVMDAFSGGYWRMETKQNENWTIFPYQFDGTASLLLRLRPGVSAAPAKAQIPIDVAYSKVLGEVELDSIELSEPNVLLLDHAEYRLTDDKDWQPEEEILRIDNAVRRKLNLPLKMDNFSQTWTIPEEDRKPITDLTLKFTIESTVEVSGASLALEDAELVTIILNGVEVPSKPSGWWVDMAIKTVSLPPLPVGTSILQIVYPFGLTTNLERIYILGDFGVTIRGRRCTITALDHKSLDFGDYTQHGLPFYAGNVTYNCHFTIPPTPPAHQTNDEKEQQLVISIPQFVAPLLSISVNGKPAGKILTEPRSLLLPPTLTPGTRHAISITAFGNRENAFGTLHLPDGLTTWYGPNEFRTDRPGWWMREYNIKRMGVLTRPMVKGWGTDGVLIQPHILRFPYERAQQRR